MVQFIIDFRGFNGGGQKFNLFEILQRYAGQKEENIKKKEPITAFLLMRVIGSSSLYLAP
jgi:hypothetical protein